MELKATELTIEDGIGLVTLNRPERMNSMAFSVYRRVMVCWLAGRSTTSVSTATPPSDSPAVAAAGSFSVVRRNRDCHQRE